MKQLFVVLFLSVCAVVAKAQTAIEFNAGYSSNSVDGSLFSPVHGSGSFYPEVICGIDVYKNIGVDFGIGYSRTGYRTNNKEGNRRCAFDYFTVPVLATYVCPFNRYYAKALIGFNFNFFTGQNVPDFVPNDPEWMNHTIGLCYGLEVGRKISSSLDAHFLFKTNNDLNKIDEFEMLHGKTRSFRFLLGIRYKMACSSK